jgi:hypothetical protein
MDISVSTSSQYIGNATELIKKCFDDDFFHTAVMSFFKTYLLNNARVGSESHFSYVINAYGYVLFDRYTLDDISINASFQSRQMQLPLLEDLNTGTDQAYAFIKQQSKDQVFVGLKNFKLSDDVLLVEDFESSLEQEVSFYQSSTGRSNIHLQTLIQSNRLDFFINGNRAALRGMF